MLFRVRRAAETATINVLDVINNAVDSVNITLTTINKSIFWCSDQIEQNLSESAKSAWLEHQAQLRGFTSADAMKRYEAALAKKAAEEENTEINNLSKEQPKEKTKAKTKSGS